MIARFIKKEKDLLDSKFVLLAPKGAIPIMLDRSAFEKKGKNGNFLFNPIYKSAFDSLAIDALYEVVLCTRNQKNYIKSFEIMPSGINNLAAHEFLDIYDGANFGLAWDKFPIYENDKFQILNHKRLDFAQPLAKYSNAHVEQLVKALKIKQNQKLKALCRDLKLSTHSKEAFTRWRLVVGMGEQNVYENNLTLHPVFGIPYIPGSAIKGRIRHYVVREYFNNDESIAFKSDSFIKIFGTARAQDANRGSMIFMDAYPTTPPNYAPDVMTVHYPDYYKKEGEIPANDWEDPNPIYFIAVEGTSFQFDFSIKNDVEIKLGKKDFANMKTMIDSIFPDLVNEFGFGAKTLKGYGKLEIKNNVSA